jgi:hypothetical protein
VMAVFSRLEAHSSQLFQGCLPESRGQKGLLQLLTSNILLLTSI